MSEAVTTTEVPLIERDKEELVRIIERLKENLQWYVDERNRLIAAAPSLVPEPPHIEDPVIAKKYVLVPRDLKCHKCGCAEPWKDPARYEVAEVLESIAVPEPPEEK